MDVGTLLSVIQTLLAALSCNQLQQMWSIWGNKSMSDLDELSGVVATVKKVLLDAEARYDELSQETLLYIQELGDALYNADDLLDEFVTLARQRQLMEDHKFIKKVRLFFSRYNQIGVAYNMSQGVQKVMRKLDSIAGKHSKFGLNLDHGPIRRKRDETCSYPDTQIIGRAEDVEKIVGMLLDSEIREDVSFLTVVGMGGLGKTALAQLVYNHEKIVETFPLRFWACVSDHARSKLDVKTILAQIIVLATGKKHDEESSMEVVVNQVREVLAQGRFLIVLDDLWTESRDELGKLVGHLVGGEGGNLVVVTTRSKETAKIVGNGLMYELKGLSDEDSWHLFQIMAFEQVLDQLSPPCYAELVSIGQEIVKICANVPLAIRVIGRLLYGQEISKWVTIRELGVANLREDQDGIKPILKLSYHNLESPLKSCFSHCSLFPKDHEIEKELMICLWMAQGYIVPLEKGQSIEDASEEYFSILLARCFFQDVKVDERGEIFSFKLHDLMHDVALEVAEKETCPATAFDVDKAVRHVSLMGKSVENYRSTMNHIRTFLYVGPNRSPMVGIDVGLLLAKFRCVRTLDLSFLYISILPASIGKLIHLRYVNLSHSGTMEALPKSITKLYNLQTLNLDFCRRLKELSKDFSKLVNLRVLSLCGCTNLASMPCGMGKLTGLWRLSMFAVGRANSSLKQHVELEGLKTLKKLRGAIEIVISFPTSDAFVKDHAFTEEAYIRDKEHLHTITFICKHEDSDQKVEDYEEELLGALQPHSNLKELILVGYRGIGMPRWAEGDKLPLFLPNLARLELSQCSELRCLSSLGNLQHLKSLFLSKLPNLEHIESYSVRCLNTLVLSSLPKLKEWWEPSGEMVNNDNSISISSSSSSSKEPQQSSLFFPELTLLQICDCPDFVSFLSCPKLKHLYLLNFNEKLRVTTPAAPTLRQLNIDNMAWLLYSLPIESLQSLASLGIQGNNEVESLSDFRQVLCACSSSLQTLSISSCSKIRKVFGGLGYLAALESLYLSDLPMLNLADEEVEDGENEGEEVLRGPMCHTLQSLKFFGCQQLQSFPKWMKNLTSLRQLTVAPFCSKELYERCQNPGGEDWPNIQHIPHIGLNCLASLAGASAVSK